MTEKEVYDYILDGSNIIHENKEWGDEKVEFEGKMVYALNIDRIELALAYFQTRGYKVQVCVDYSTHKKYTQKKLPIKPERSAYNDFISNNKEIIQRIQMDFDLVKLKQENPGSIIITNDSFNSWIKGEDEVPDFTKNEWENEAKTRKEFGFKDGKFTLARKNYNFTKGKELPDKPKGKKKVEPEETGGPNYLAKISSRLQSLDDRGQSQTTKINNINSVLQDLNSLVQELATYGTQSNTSALIPCKFEDEFGQSHLCLFGKNLYIWEKGKWTELNLQVCHVKKFITC